MKRPLFRGCATALVTPFTEDGSIDFDVLGKLIEYQISHGADALVSCGTTGEAAAMTDRERLSVVEYTVWKTAGRIPVIAGTGTNNTRQSVELTRCAQTLGANGVLAVCPYYNKPTQEGMIAHFSALADCSDLPVILYTVPSRTGSGLTCETLEVLSRHPNVLGLKDASGSLSEGAKTRYFCGDDLPIYSGDDGCILPCLSIGGMGVISVVSNILPHTVHTLCEKWFSGDLAGASADQIALMPLVSALFRVTNPIPVKAALEKLGFPEACYRLPLCPMDGEKKAELFRILSPWLEEGGILA